MGKSANVKIVSVQKSEEAIIVCFDDGSEFVYPASVLHSVIPRDQAIARRVGQALLPRISPQGGFVN